MGYNHVPVRPPVIMSPVPSLFQFCDGVRDEFEGYVRDLLGRVAHDYQLKEQELVTRYLTSVAPHQSPVSLAMVQSLPVVSPRPRVEPLGPIAPAPVTSSQVVGAKKRGRKPAPGIESLDLSRNLTPDEIQGLTIPTLKAVCKHHGLKITGSRPELVGRLEAWQANPNDPLLKKKKGGRAKRAPGPKEPEHSHPVDDKIHPDCEQCQAYGNPLAPEQSREEFEVAETPDAPDAPQAPMVPPMALVPECDFEIAEPVEPEAALEAAESPVCEIQPAESPPKVETPAAPPKVSSPVSSPREELKSKLAALLSMDQEEQDSDDDQESQCSYGDEILDDDDELEMEGFDYE